MKSTRTKRLLVIKSRNRFIHLCLLLFHSSNINREQPPQEFIDLPLSIKKRTMCEVQQFKPSGKSQAPSDRNSRVLRRGPGDPKLPAGGLEALYRLPAVPSLPPPPPQTRAATAPALQAFTPPHAPRLGGARPSPGEKTRARSRGSPAAPTGTDRSPSGLASHTSPQPTSPEP